MILPHICLKSQDNINKTLAFAQVRNSLFVRNIKQLVKKYFLRIHLLLHVSKF